MIVGVGFRKHDLLDLSVIVQTPDLFRLFTSVYNFTMVLTPSLSIIGLVLVSFATKTAFAQISNCTENPWQVTVNASASYNTTITSPNYPEKYYDSNLKCNWLIKVDSKLSGYILKVTFNDFLLELDNYDQYCTDVLKFYDGMDKLSLHLGSYCGFYHPEVIYSTGQYLFVQFLTNAVYGNRGFSFSVLAVKEEEASGICRPWNWKNEAVYSLHGTSGTFFSPDYPVPYQDGVTCIWTISVPAGKRVKLVFEDVQLEDYNCKSSIFGSDYVQIRDGQDPESKELARICDYYPAGSPPAVYTTGSHMWVKFSSIWDYSKHWTGFKARFEAVEPPPTSREICFAWNIYNNDLKLTGSRETLQSPEEPFYFPLGPSCDWLITVPEGYIVKLSFDSFELEPSIKSGCTAEYVEVLDGSDRNSESKGRFCGLTAPDDIRSSDRYMWVVFRSDSEYPHYRGFKATFTTEEKPKSSLVIVAIVVSVVVFIGLVCCIVCIVKRKKKPSGADDARIPMTTTTTSASHSTRREVVQQPPPLPTQSPPPVGYAPVPTNSSLPPPAYPDQLQPPPPYPGDEPVPQYSPPGQSYPWLHPSAPVNASSPPEGP